LILQDLLTSRKRRAKVIFRLQRFRRLLPWLIGFAILAYVLLPYRLPEKRGELVQAFTAAPPWVAAVAAVGALVAYLADTLVTWCVFAWTNVRMRYREVAVIRGLTYFLSIVNYNLGQAAIVVVLARRGVRAARATGIILFMMGINLVVLVAFASASVSRVEPRLRYVVWTVAALLPVYLAIIAWRPRVLASRELFAPLFELGLRGHLLASLARVPHVLAMMFAHFAIMRSFGVAVPITTAALYIPIIFVVAVLPISVQGLGTTQVVAVNLLASFAPSREAVLAYSLCLQVLWTLALAIIGATCLRTELGRSIRAAATDR
jgi:uncharacterized membrane protein YbhN (UPF0104 family)